MPRIKGMLAVCKLSPLCYHSSTTQPIKILSMRCQDPAQGLTLALTHSFTMFPLFSESFKPSLGATPGLPVAELEWGPELPDQMCCASHWESERPEVTGSQRHSTYLVEKICL